MLFLSTTRPTHERALHFGFGCITVAWGKKEREKRGKECIVSQCEASCSEAIVYFQRNAENTHTNCLTRLSHKVIYRSLLGNAGICPG
jgi:hypothetical protein